MSASAVPHSKVTKTRAIRATEKKTWIENEVVYYFSLKNGGVKVCYLSFGSPLLLDFILTVVSSRLIMRQLGTHWDD